METPAGPVLVVVTQPGTGGGILSFTLNAGAAPALADQVAFGSDPTVLLQNDVSVAEIDGEAILLLSGFGQTGLVGQTVSNGGQFGTAFALTPSDGSMSTAPLSVSSLGSGGQTFVFAGDAATGGVRAYVVGQDNSLQPASYQRDTESSYLADVADFATVTINGLDYLLTVSATEPGVMVHRIDPATGQLTETGSLGAIEGLGVAGTTDIEIAEIGGQYYAIVAGTNSSSITVLRIGPDGSLTATDHIVDSLSTRFGNVTALEVLEVNGWVFVFAGGGDDGISMFVLMPDGTLVHLQTVADTSDLSLENVSALAAAVVGGEIQLYAASATEAGLTEFTVATGSLGALIQGDAANQTFTGSSASDLIQGGSGNETLRGNAGNDILKDGAGSDTLLGGSGADLFVLSADGVSDTIQDFQPGVDRLDLSAWQMLYSTGQIGCQMTATGAILTFRGETLVINSANGTPLTLAQIFQGEISGPYRPPLVLFEPGNTLTGTPGRDTLTGGVGNDTISGLDGDDLLFGEDGDDSILGGGGNDVIHGGGGDDDLVCGDAGDDEIHAGAGNDTVHGGSGRDLIYLNQGDDVFYDSPETGAAGSDRVYGHLGDDTFHSGGGNDTLWGGGGADAFVFYTGNEVDTIADFEDGIDTIVFDVDGLGYGNLTLAQSGSTAIITFDGGEIRLSNFSIGDLSPDDFVFV